MTQNSVLDIIDRDGWRKAHPFQKRIIHIGSDAQNDIVLSSWRGGGVAPRHLQLITLPDSQGVYRLVNLGDTDILLGAAGDRALAPRAAVEITSGEQVRLGDFSLIFRGRGELTGVADSVPVTGVVGAAHTSGFASTQASSRLIGLELFLPTNQLEPDRSIDGSLMVRNLGDKPAVQFKLAVEGLHPDCYDIGTGPLLFPNAEREVFFHLFHPRGPNLLAGKHRFSVRAKAPEAYPGESVTVSQVVHVLPFFDYTLRLVTAN